ncbi:MAG: Na+/H+ antiporter [Paenibacillus sp.]|nr:Na+/H+ antiporter [Paenibacillus sp.]
MELFLMILLLLGLIGCSNIVNRHIPFIPVPLIQIALGSLIALFPFGTHMHLEPELFFVLFIAPLLYNDGKHAPRSELWRLRVPILLLSIGLVFATVFLIGYAIHWMIPSIPLPVAFGLAAILSPTDAVAVSSIAGRIHLPKSLMHLLEGEALMNDASGLVAFKFAVAATLTGVFSLSTATVSFLWIAIGGLLIGAVVAFIVTFFRLWLRRSGLEDETMHMLIHLLTPFALYLTAEELGVSGILAAVAGGVVHAVERERTARLKPSSNELSDNTWSVIVFILNGLVFVILGLQLPQVLGDVFAEPHFNNFEVLGYALIIYIMLIVLRFLWAYLFLQGRSAFNRQARKPKISLRILAMTSLSGVRGAVTLAGAFSIPLLLDNGSPFPERSLVLFLAAVVILLSLIAASTLLPLLAKRDPGQKKVEIAQILRIGQQQMLDAAIQAVHRATNEHNKAESASVIGMYELWRRQLETGKMSLQRRDVHPGEWELRMEAIEIERNAVTQLLESNQITAEHAAYMFGSLQELKLLLSGRKRLFILMLKMMGQGLGRVLFKKQAAHSPRIAIQDQQSLRMIKQVSCNAVVANFEQRQACNETAAVISHYNHILQRLSAPFPFNRQEDAGDDGVRVDLQWIALQAERDEVQSLFERGQITRDIANQLKRTIRNREAAVLD